MSCETERECGYRKIGGLYLVGEPGLAAPCDRLPLAIVPCSTCGAEPRFTRSIAAINPKALWGHHAVADEPSGIHPQEPGPCGETDAVCIPSEKGWLMWVGREYTVESFRKEADLQGVSKRIHAIPKDLELGVDWVYLAKQRLIPGSSQMWLPGEAEERAGYGPGVFEVFRPTRVEKVVSDLSGQDTLDELYAQGVTPVTVSQGDPNHR